MKDKIVEIYEEMTTNIEIANRQAKMVQAQLSRIERKLFTKQENFEFLLGLTRDMLGKDVKF